MAAIFADVDAWLMSYRTGPDAFSGVMAGIGEGGGGGGGYEKECVWRHLGRNV